MSVKIWFLSYGPKTSRLTNQNGEFFKLQYLTNLLSYDVEFLYTTRHPQKQQFYPVISGGHDHASLVMPKVLLNSELGSPQE